MAAEGFRTIFSTKNSDSASFFYEVLYKGNVSSNDNDEHLQVTRTICKRSSEAWGVNQGGLYRANKTDSTKLQIYYSYSWPFNTVGTWCRMRKLAHKDGSICVATMDTIMRSARTCVQWSGLTFYLVRIRVEGMNQVLVGYLWRMLYRDKFSE